MFKKTFFVLYLALFCGTVLPACAQVAGTPSPPLQPEYIVEGVITYLEVDGSVVVQPAQGPDKIVYIKDFTKISRNGEPATAKDLKRGDHVKVAVGAMRYALEMTATGP
jgi:hypothetical protein